MRRLALLSALPLLAACGMMRRASESAPDATTARAELRNADGQSVGSALLQQTPHGVLITADLANLPAGTHAIHIHAVGRCDAPFTTAGGHFNPTSRKHGVRVEQGYHAGDLPNVVIPASGSTRVEMLATTVSLGTTGNGLFDGDGSALVVHGAADDYRTDPAGNAGPRIACGAVTH